MAYPIRWKATTCILRIQRAGYELTERRPQPTDTYAGRFAIADRKRLAPNSARYHAPGGIDRTDVVNDTGPRSVPPENPVPSRHHGCHVRATRLYGSSRGPSADATRQSHALSRG